MRQVISSALIGCSGFVGSTLLKQRHFEGLYRSTNIREMMEREFDLVVCCGVSAKKWLANQEPEQDRSQIQSLMDVITTIRARIFVLISTVDVNGTPVDFVESDIIEESGLHPYGLHRRQLERFVQSTFDNHLIVRLPGLVGPELRKNILYDFHHENNLNLIDSRSVFQFYPMVNLSRDIDIALYHKLSLIHLVAEPVSVAEVAAIGFNRSFGNILTGNPALYDMKSQYAQLFEGRGSYQYSKRESLMAIRHYAQGEKARNERE